MGQKFVLDDIGPPPPLPNNRASIAPFEAGREVEGGAQRPSAGRKMLLPKAQKEPALPSSTHSRLDLYIKIINLRHLFT